jgi:hypothetical protein
MKIKARVEDATPPQTVLECLKYFCEEQTLPRWKVLRSNKRTSHIMIWMSWSCGAVWKMSADE